jgi:ankyrin repeat protein
MKYIKLFENFEDYDLYELMIMHPNKKTEMLIQEIRKPKPNVNIVSDLINLGANLDWQDRLSQNRTALHLATYSLPFTFIPPYYSSEIAGLIIDAGADTNIQDSWGDTPLHVVVRNNKSIIVQMLIDAGARTDIQNHDGKAPYELAQTEEMKKLLQP